MTEVEKLYSLAGVEKILPPICSDNERFCKDCCEYIKDAIPYCKSATYPLFTAEKQLEIVKFLLNKSVYYDTYGDREYWFHLSDEIENSKYREFDEAIAECINKMWEDLRDYEKVQIKEILE